MKSNVQEDQPSNVNELKNMLKHLWVAMVIKYFEKLADLMPQKDLKMSFKIV